MLARELLEQWPPSSWQGRRTVVAISGGPDSVALLLAATELASPAQVVAAHFNHHWRGDASDADQAWVQELCARLGVTCATNPTRPASHNTLSQTETQSCVTNATSGADVRTTASLEVGRSEDRARAERYKFLTEVAYAHGASYVATGHTADDRVETVLHNLLRGTGLAGAAALRLFRPLDQDLVLARPLLTKTRRDVMNFLNERGQTFRTDATNADERFRRNFLRGSVLPLVQQHYPQASSNLLRFAQLTEATLADLELLAKRWLCEVEQLVNSAHHGPPATMWPSSNYWIFPHAAATGQVWSVVREALRLTWMQREWPLGAMTQSHWDAIRLCLSAPSASPTEENQVALSLPGGLHLTCWREFWAIGRPPNL